MKKLIFTILLVLSVSVKADDVECTAIALSAFTAKYIELNGCGISGGTSIRALDLFNQCKLSPSTVLNVMSRAKTDVAAMSCTKSKELYVNLTSTINHIISK